MQLTVGPNQFFWKPEEWSRFYSDLTKAPIDRVVLGELVCSKRLPFYNNLVPGVVEALIAAGKEVALTSLALITLKRERKQAAELTEAGAEVEINDLTMLNYLPKGTAFSVGPLVNVYNEGTLLWLAERGATRVCLPPELPLAAITALTQVAKEAGVGIEVWAHGRLPLAISGRCYHARLHGRIKDNCLFACEDDPDGLPVETVDDQPFLAMNGVQTLSGSCASMANHYDTLREIGISSLRLSPQSQNFTSICQAWRQRVDNHIDSVELARQIDTLTADIRLSDGFVAGQRGADWSGTQSITPKEMG